VDARDEPDAAFPAMRGMRKWAQRSRALEILLPPLLDSGCRRCSLSHTSVQGGRFHGVCR
jgi:hypothetical protein